ncbi:hypothetical protein M8C21_011883 [Ambrosia artemisiifolia]|uniref:RRM domain-containing protein n=1 Tax=Ambrosia artemisiifolia TaxID=4212 RepID=A0AAD5GER4_AMBAR|nr:hypothetical protein M8C21_011883 [Ambrosia artemisiifolia]
MDPSAEEKYAAFQEKVKKSIHIDNLSPQVTEAVLKSALGQFGKVTAVHLIPTYFTSGNVCALVEMESAKQAEEIVAEMGDSPLMVSGMPRPVRAQKAKVEMFEDRPKKHERRIVCRWMDPTHPSFELAKKIKNLTKRHAAEAQYLMEQELADEQKLHNQQNETLQANYEKYKLIDGAQGDGALKRLAGYYGTTLDDC